MSERPEVLRYKQEVSLEDRKTRCAEIMSTYKDNIPLLILPGAGIKNPKPYKFIMAKSIVVTTLIHRIRQQLYLSESEGIFLYFADGTPFPLLQRDMVLNELYEVKKDEDNYLYLIVATQERLGH